jgi:hypothetical protein
MAQTSQTDHRDLLARSGAPMAQGRVGGDPRTQQRCDDVELESVGDPQDEVFVDDDVVGVAAIADCPVAIHRPATNRNRNMSSQSNILLVEDNPDARDLAIRLPKIMGLDVLKRLHADERTKLVPVVVLAGSSEESDRYQSGVNAYVAEPVEFEPVEFEPVEFEAFSEAVKAVGLF